MKIGIIQGRLSPPQKNHIQEFPVYWEKEFALLNMLGLNHIEWIVTEKSFGYNPLFSNKLYGLPISSICADVMVNKNFYNKDFINKYLNIICEAAIKNNIFCITIPLLEDSSIEDDNIRGEFLINIMEVVNKYPSLLFSFETDLSMDKLETFIHSNNNFFITYDTGNSTFTYGIHHTEFIYKFHDKINNVHLKDRVVEGHSVSPGKGDTRFHDILYSLKKISYSGLYTIQTAREESGDEINTIKKHRIFFENIEK